MMRKGLFFILLPVLCLMTFTYPVSAQNGRWDTALDQYEAICDRCIELRSLSLSGQPVSSDALTSLLLQLSSLRKQLQTAEGEMTPAQRKRFIMIRNRYQSVPSARQEASEPLAPLQYKGPETLPVFSSAPAFRKPVLRPQPSLQPPVLTEGIVAFAGLPDSYPGIMGFLQRKRWGGYIKGAATVGAVRSEYSGLSDGTSDGAMVWTSGREKLLRRSVSAGFVISLTDFLRLYGGPNYGLRDILWEDVSGKWMTVSDLSHKGWGADTGVLLCWKHLAVMAGGSYTHGSPIQAELGFGLLF